FEAPAVEIKEDDFVNLRKKEHYISSENINHDAHYGYKCDGCNVDPIIGTRWSCSDCLFEINLCDKCKESNWESSNHSSSHTLEKVKTQSFVDEDYMDSSSLPEETKYLDF